MTAGVPGSQFGRRALPKQGIVEFDGVFSQIHGVLKVPMNIRVPGHAAEHSIDGPGGERQRGFGPSFAGLSREDLDPTEGWSR